MPKHFVDDKEKQLIFDIQNLAIERYGSIRGLARACHMNRKIMDRLYANGVFSLSSFSAIKLCYALHITPNQLYGFEPLPALKPKLEVQTSSINLNVLSYREMHHKLNDLLFEGGYMERNRLAVVKIEDRVTIIKILAVNGYTTRIVEDKSSGKKITYVEYWREA